MLVAILAIILTSALVGFIAGALLAERVVRDVHSLREAMNEIDGCLHADVFELQSRIEALEAAAHADVAKAEVAVSDEVKAVEQEVSKL